MKKQLLVTSMVAFGLIMALVSVCQAQSEEPGPQLPQSEEPQSEEPQAEEPQAEEPNAAQATSVRPLVFQAAGPTVESIQGTVAAFRTALGEPNNGNSPGPLTVGRREINWDGGSNTNDTTSPVPPVTPFDVFLNSRGARFITPGIGLTQAPVSGPEPGAAWSASSIILPTAPFSRRSAHCGCSLQREPTSQKLCFSYRSRRAASLSEQR